MRRPRAPRIRVLLVVLALLAVGGLVYALSGLAQQQLLPLLQGASLAVVAALCFLVAFLRTRRR